MCMFWKRKGRRGREGCVNKWTDGRTYVNCPFVCLIVWEKGGVKVYREVRILNLPSPPLFSRLELGKGKGE